LTRFCALLALVACVGARQVTRSRPGWKNCRAADPNVIECGGKVMAHVECFEPGDETCGALAVRYADGERIFLYRPPGFEPGHGSEIDPVGVIRPELASNGRMIWFKVARAPGEDWTVFDAESGTARDVGPPRIFAIREKDPHSMPLWVVTPE
jgi:hypothetical protein